MFKILQTVLHDHRVRLPFVGEFYAEVEVPAPGLPFFEVRRERNVSELWAGPVHVYFESRAVIRRREQRWQERQREADMA